MVAEIDSMACSHKMLVMGSQIDSANTAELGSVITLELLSEEECSPAK